MEKLYTYDCITKTHLRSNSRNFNYSDGEEVEIRLFNIIETAHDVSTTSIELVNAIVDWPSEYHLSKTRHNLLRPLNIKAHHRVLELGSGCGAMTRYLGETGATVVAVEGSKRRAQISASRCRDLPNVTIYCDNLIDFVNEEKFDFVTLIGVLEYAPKFIQSHDPIIRCLEHARSFLKEDGILVLAIENQLGLKYFNGFAEDHLGVPYYGINDLYCKTDPITFGRHTISEKLNTAGFHKQKFLFPFPDYKHPTLILDESAFLDKRLNIPDLLHRSISNDHTGQNRRTFHEQLAWKPIADNNLIPDLANSFLVLAAIHENCLSDTTTSWLARTYTSERLPAFSTETIFSAQENNICVEKKQVHPPLSGQETRLGAGNLLHQIPSRDVYTTGNLYITEIQTPLARGAGIESFAKWASDWINILLHNTNYHAGKAMLSGEWLDAIPTNFIRNSNGELVQIDKEWNISCEIPLCWIIIRGIINSLATCPTSPKISHLTYRQIVHNTLAIEGLHHLITDEMFSEYCEYDAQLRTIVFGSKYSPTSVSDMLNRPAEYSIGGRMLQEEVEMLRSEINRIKSTTSWQVTKPIRLLANLPSIAWEKLSKIRYKSSL